MNRAFYKSLNKFDICQNAKASAENTGSAAAVGGANDGTGSSIAASEMSGTEASQSSELIDATASTASSDMSGTEKSVSTIDAESTGYEYDSDAIESASTSALGAVDDQTVDSGNGKIPEDIPPADNDSVLEAQIRQAAINETDPDIKAKLWNEYRWYKGMPKAN